jgi:hypothetical protein
MNTAELLDYVRADLDAARRAGRPFCGICGDRLVTPAASQTHCEACLPEAAARGEQQPMQPTDLIIHLQTHINAARKSGANVAQLPLADLEAVVARVRNLEFALRVSEATARAAVDQYEAVLAKLGATEAERDALKAAADDWRNKPTYEGEPTGDQLVDRLREVAEIAEEMSIWAGEPMCRHNPELRDRWLAIRDSVLPREGNADGKK